jgi:immunity protein 5 of polymorphic toxin system
MKAPKLVKTSLDEQVSDLVATANHKTLVVWACDCAERVLPFFEARFPDDDRPRRAIELGRAWVETGIFRMREVRTASLAAHAAARAAQDDDVARAAARAAGQAVAAAHVAGHAIAAAIYAATAVRDRAAATDAMAAATEERQWQYRHLLELLERQSRREAKGLTFKA